MDFNKIENAASKAYGRIDKVVGNTTEDLSIYSGLNDDAFRAISDKYGSEELMKYIKAMEFRRLNNANKTV